MSETNFLRRLLRALHRVEDGLLVALLGGMIGLAITQIVLRNGWQTGLLWGDTALRVLVLWVGLFGAVVAAREQRHISIDVATKWLPAGLRRGAGVLNALFTAVVCGILAWYCLSYVRLELEAPSIAFGIVPTWLTTAIMPLGFGLIALRYGVQALLLALGRERAAS